MTNLRCFIDHVRKETVVAKLRSIMQEQREVITINLLSFNDNVKMKSCHSYKLH